MRVSSITCLKCLHALSAYALYVPTCLRASNYYMTTCLKLLCAYAPMCPYFSRASVLTCLYIFFYKYIFIIYILHICLYIFLFPAYVRSFFTCSRAYNHSQNILWLTSIPCIAVSLWIFDLSFHSKLQNKLLLLKLHTPSLSCGVLLSQLVHVQKQ